VTVLSSQVEASDAFDERRARMEELVAELRERTAQVARGGGEKALEKHRSRGKLTARERVDRLLDPDTAFLELSALAAWELYDGQAPGAGIVTGIGVIWLFRTLPVPSSTTCARTWVLAPRSPVPVPL